MKNIYIFLQILLLFFITEIRGQIQFRNEELITLDVRMNYSSTKELIFQDLFDVEYIVLETNNEFLNQGKVRDIGNEIILVTNIIQDGDIFVYERNGKALRKINHKGQGPRDYINILGIALDENNNEMFVNDSYSKKIIVYDLLGNFKRSFEHKTYISNLLGGGESGQGFYTEIRNYDKDNLICYDEFNNEISFYLISKHDGNITREIKIPFKEKLFYGQFRRDNSGRPSGASAGPVKSIIPTKSNWMLLEYSSDTIYSLLPDYNLCPIIARIPSLKSMNPEVFLMIGFVSNCYYFMETIQNEYNWNTKRGFPRTYLMYDKQEKTFSGYKVYNGDYITKKAVNMMGFNILNIGSWQRIEAHQLVEDYKAGILNNGKLKEIASKLDQEDNPVIMLTKHK